ncbi:hypothetical protein C7S14_4671 [Burkholderia cepacia]|nr:hypothetical protein C7S14_4671 [Burkholderia cepacia]
MRGDKPEHIHLLLLLDCPCRNLKKHRPARVADQRRMHGVRSNRDGSPVRPCSGRGRDCTAVSGKSV